MLDRTPRPADGLDYPFAAPPGPGETMEVAPGVLWVRMPLPYALDHINLWLLANGDGWTMVDTGIRSDETRRLWETVFATALKGRPVTQLIATHHHPDHAGLSAWLSERWRVPVMMTETEWLMARALALDLTPASTRWMVEFYRRAGCDAAALDAFAGEGNSYAPVVEIASSYLRIADGESLRVGANDWRIIVGRGHSPELACLHAPGPGLLICGDQLLPRITPNVSVWPEEPEANPLPLFLQSLRALRQLPDDTLVLPSHKLPYRGVQTRIAALLRHHDERLDRVRDACGAPVTAMQVVAAMFRPDLDRHQLMFAVGEALAHLHHLCAEGEIKRRTGGDGVHLFQRQ